MSNDNKPKIASVDELISKARGREKEIALELRTLFDALIDKMNEGLAVGVVCNLGLDNGDVSGKAEVKYFDVRKVVEHYQAPDMPQPGRR